MQLASYLHRPSRRASRSHSSSHRPRLPTTTCDFISTNPRHTARRACRVIWKLRRLIRRQDAGRTQALQREEGESGASFPSVWWLDRAALTSDDLRLAQNDNITFIRVMEGLSDSDTVC